MIKKIKLWLISVFNGGILYFFGSSILSKICSFLSSVFVIRLLSKNDYGEYVNANNQYSYISIFICIGLCNAVLQYCSENVNAKRKNSIFDYSLFVSIIANVILTGVVILLALINYYIGNKTVSLYILFMSILPLLAGMNEYFLTVFRVRQDNKKYAVGNVVFSTALLIGNIVFTRIINVYGLVLATALAYIVSSLYCIRYLNADGFFVDVRGKRNDLTYQSKKEISKFAVTCALTNFVSVILTLIDISCLNLLLNRSEVLASYQVASVIPTACMFIPNCLMLYYYPILVGKNSKTNKMDIKFVSQLLLVFGGINGFISLFLFLFAPLIVSLAFSNNYSDAVPIFRILVANFFVSGTFTKVFGNVIFTLKRVKVNFIHAILAGVLNIILDFVLIVRAGSIGAAIATLTISVFLSILKAFYIIRFED